MQSVLTQLARPASDGCLSSRTDCSSPSTNSPTQPMTPLSPLTLSATASTASLSSLSSLSAYSPNQPASPALSPVSPPAIQHVLPSLPPTFTLLYHNASYKVHPHLLSHHSPLFRNLLTTQPGLSSYRIPAMEQCSGEVVLLLLQALYSLDAAVPDSCASLAVPAGSRASTLDTRMKLHIQPLLALAAELQLAAVVGWCDRLLAAMLAVHVKKGACRLPLLLHSLLLCRLYALGGMRTECVRAVARWDGPWWRSSEWEEVRHEVDADSATSIAHEMRLVGGKEREEGATALLLSFEQA